VPSPDCVPATGGCAALCRAACESPFNTAPPRARGWLLVEHPGPWPAFGWPADLPPEARTALAAAPEHAVRPQLIRRPDRTGRRADPHRTVLTAGGPRGARWLERHTTDDLATLAKLDLARLAGGGPPGFGELVADRILIVCTHAKRDACCARFGAPVARDLAARGLPVWETTHLGGDRFAANLVCLPEGTYHGMLDQTSAPEVAAACLRGAVSEPYYRGTAGEPHRPVSRISPRSGTVATADTAR
jgi:hypothetical protein